MLGAFQPGIDSSLGHMAPEASLRLTTQSTFIYGMPRPFIDSEPEHHSQYTQ